MIIFIYSKALAEILGSKISTRESQYASQLERRLTLT